MFERGGGILISSSHLPPFQELPLHDISTDLQTWKKKKIPFGVRSVMLFT